MSEGGREVETNIRIDFFFPQCSFVLYYYIPSLVDDVYLGIYLSTLTRYLP